MSAAATMRAIHVARRELGLEEDDYRALLERVTGERSLRAMTPAQLFLVVDTLRASGAPARRLTGPYAGKLQALWISAWNLGLVRDRRDSAMLAFVRRQTGIEHTRFLRDAQDARKAVEALKSWIAREGGVNWAEHPDPEDCVIAAQRRRLGTTPGAMAVTADQSLRADTAEAIRRTGKRAMMQMFGEMIRALPEGGV